MNTVHVQSAQIIQFRCCDTGCLRQVPIFERFKKKISHNNIPGDMHLLHKNITNIFDEEFTY